MIIRYPRPNKLVCSCTSARSEQCRNLIRRWADQDTKTILESLLELRTDLFDQFIGSIEVGVNILNVVIILKRRDEFQH